MFKRRIKIDLSKMSVASASTPWHAVSVVTKGACCAAARGLGGSRFLSREAPRLPLAACGAPAQCACSYKHHADRRGRIRRRADATGLPRSVPAGQERRAPIDRRKADA